MAVAVWGVLTILKGVHRHGPEIGAAAPEISGKNVAGEEVSLKSFPGKVVLLNFWATWCGPCQEEMPSLERLYQKFKDQGFVVVGLSLDEDGKKSIEAFLTQVPVTFPIVIDETQSSTDRYEVYRIPETYLIDSKGNIADQFIGPQNFDQPVFEDKITRLLSKPQS